MTAEELIKVLQMVPGGTEVNLNDPSEFLEYIEISWRPGNDIRMFLCRSEPC